MMKTKTLRVAGWCAGLAVFAQAVDALEAAPAVVGSKLPCADSEVVRYTAHRVARPMVIDGKLDEPAWKFAPASSRYVDILTGAPAIHDTRAKIVWDDQNLYLGIRVEEPSVRATFTQQNSPIYQENDIEVFIAGPDAYYEFEVNALNTTYEVFFLWES
ncbi:MAG: carbohydrate-binding family 9-like protein, partial [Verrucomicrobiota bacterium]